MEAKTKDFDDRLAAETKRRLDELQQKLEKEKEEALAGLKEETAQRLENLQGIKSRGLKEEAAAPLSLIEYTDIPTILVEAGFLSNDSDLSYLKSEKKQDAMAKAIADGILQAFDKET